MKTVTRTYFILSNGDLRITVDGKATVYRVRISPLTDDGEFAVELAKVGSRDVPYHVTVSEYGAACDCWGFLRHGHCKHASSVRALANLKPDSYKVEPQDPFEDTSDLEPVYDVAIKLMHLDDERLDELQADPKMTEAVQIARRLKAMREEKREPMCPF